MCYVRKLEYRRRAYSEIIIRADNISNLLPKYDVNDIELKQFSMSATVDDVVDEIINLNSFNVLGIGNIVGWGEEFLQKIKVYKS